jgi:hypothetical protein
MKIKDRFLRSSSSLILIPSKETQREERQRKEKTIGKLDGIDNFHQVNKTEASS